MVVEEEEQSKDVYPDGSLTKVVFHNFLTFDDLVFLPGPNLNVIIGPNGNGKSSIICGICLAVGGDPKVLGRSTKVGDYVKHGCDQGYVEVHIRDSKEEADVCAKILINQSKHFTDYFLNGSRVSRNELRQRIASYNIQIDNPCTFLAQDKVRSFAEQNPNVLLKNTEKASSSSLVNLHENLEQLQEVGAKRTGSHKTLHRKLTTIANELKHLEPVVKNYEERKQAVEKIAMLEKKDAFLAHGEAVAAHKKRKSHLKAKEQELEKALEAIKPLEGEVQDKSELVQKLRGKIREMNIKKHEVDNELAEALSSEPVGNQFLKAKEDYERVKKEFDSWEHEIDMAKREINALTDRLEDAEAESSGASNELAAARKDYEAWRAKEEKLALQKYEIDELILKKRREEEELEQQLQKLRQFEEDRRSVFLDNRLIKQSRCHEAWRWYEEHKTEFKYPVYVPLLSIALKTAESARYLENMISPRDFLIFIFGSREDELLLNQSSFSWKINSTVITHAEVERGSVEEGLPDHLRKHGFHCMVSDLYNAVPPVKAYFNLLYRLNNIPIGSAATERNLVEICDAMKHHYRLFLTDSSRVKITVSRYSGNVAIRTDPLTTNIVWLIAHVPPSKFLDNSEKSEKLTYIKSVANKIVELQKDYELTRKRIDAAIETLRRQMADLRKQVDAVGLVKQQLRIKEVRFASLTNNKPDLEEARRGLREFKVAALNDAHRIGDSVAKLLKRSGFLIKDITLAKIICWIEKSKLDELSDKLAACKLEADAKKSEYKDYMAAVDAAADVVLESKRKLKLQTGVSDTKADKLCGEEKSVYKALITKFVEYALPDDRESLRGILNSEKARLLSLQDEGGEEDLNRYEELLNAQKELNEELRKASELIGSWRERMDIALEEWLSLLKTLIGNINQNFDSFFCRLGCAGEVCLEEPSDKTEISGYGIGIMVKFRGSEKLRRLTHQTQSGGERSVSTMLYLLALQELCPVPFRCVDEINQGMDPTNERMVFEMMVGLLSGTGNLAKTQYFLLTPKLLPGLNYGEKSTVHCIYNGTTFLKRGIDVADDIKRASMLSSHA